jgi:hypothetical protein
MLRRPSSFMSHATRFPSGAAMSSLAKGALITCRMVKEPVCASVQRTSPKKMSGVKNANAAGFISEVTILA